MAAHSAELSRWTAAADADATDFVMHDDALRVCAVALQDCQSFDVS